MVSNGELIQTDISLGTQKRYDGKKEMYVEDVNEMLTININGFGYKLTCADFNYNNYIKNKQSIKLDDGKILNLLSDDNIINNLHLFLTKNKYKKLSGIVGELKEIIGLV